MSVLEKVLREEIIQDNFYHRRMDILADNQNKNLAQMKIVGSAIDSTNHVWCYEAEFLINALGFSKKQLLRLAFEPLATMRPAPGWTSGSVKITYSGAAGRTDVAHFHFALERHMGIKLSKQPQR